MSKKKRTDADERDMDLHPEPTEEFGAVEESTESKAKMDKASDESDVKRPELKGERKEEKPKFEHPGTNNQSRVVHEEEPKETK